MKAIGKLFLGFAKVSPKSEYLPFAFKLLGLDSECVEAAVSDEEVWRTSEEGKHFKFETSTGEIKAGFGGRLNGKKIGQSWGTGNGRRVAKPKGGGSPEKPNTQGGSSRKGYWMRHLPDDKREQAAQKLVDIKSSMKHSKQKADHFKSLFNKGIVSASELDDVLRANKLDQFRDDMTPEEYVMKCQPLSERKAFLDLVGEAKDWANSGFELRQENLDKRENDALFMMISQNPDLDITPEEAASGNLDSVFDQLSPEQQQFYLDMKAKACKLPTSGKDLSEYSDEFQISVGLKEPPKKQEGPDYSWYTGTRGGTMENNMLSAIGGKVSYGHTYSKEELIGINQEFLYRLANKTMSPNQVSYNGIWAVGAMRATIFSNNPDVRNSNSPLPAEMISRLSEEEQKKLLDIVNKAKALDKYSIYATPTEDIRNLTVADLDVAESMMRRINGKLLRSRKAQQPLRDYILLQEKMLIGAEPMTEEEHAKKEQAKKEAEATERIKLAAERRETVKQNREKYAASRLDFLAKVQTAGSTEEVVDAVRKAGIFNISSPSEIQLNEVDIDCAKEIATSIDKVVGRYPFMIEKLRSLDTAERDEGSYASCSLYLGALHVNKAHYSNNAALRANYRSSVLSGFHPKGLESDSIITHEIGHAVDGFLSKSVRSVDLKGNHTFSGYLQKSVLKSLKMTKADVKAECSGYATKNPEEWFAECFAEAIHSPEPRPMAREMMRQLEDILREEGYLDD